MLLMLSCAFYASDLRADPASPDYHEFALPGGGSLSARVIGDEYWNAWQDDAGRTLIRDESDTFFYARKAPSGELIASTLRAGIDAPIDQAGLRPSSEIIARARSIAKPALAPQAGTSRTRSSSTKSIPNPPSGSRPYIAIVVGFSNRAIDTSESQWVNYYFGSSNSVAAYYSEVSGGQFTIVPGQESYGASNNGVVFVSVPGSHPNTSNSSNTAIDDRIVEAIQAANNSINFAAYDTDSNGFVSTEELGLSFVFAGYSGSAGGPSPSIWPHASVLGGNGLTVDGVRVSAYWGEGDPRTGNIFVGAEHNTGSALATVGTACHEYGHVLGLPDLYDTSDASEGIGEIGLMGGGSWTGSPSGTSPVHFCAWSRIELGWTTPVSASLGNSYNLQDAATASANLKALRIDVGGTAGEYFLVENRQGTGFDSGLPGSGSSSRGILIWHIDESNASNSSAVNNYPNFTVDVEEVGSTQNLELSPSHPNSDRGESSDFFRANNGAVFSNSSSPNSKRNDGTSSGIIIEVLSNSGSSMQVQFSSSPEPVITSIAPTTATAGVQFSYQVTATGNPAPTISGSNLPSWLSFTAPDTFSGTPPSSAVGSTVNYSVLAMNSAGNTSQSVSLEIVGGPIITDVVYPEVLRNADSEIQGNWLDSVTSVRIGGVAQAIQAQSRTSITITAASNTPLGAQTLTVSTAQGATATITVEVFASQPTFVGGITYTPPFGGRIGQTITLNNNTTTGTFAGRRVEIGNVEQLVLSASSSQIRFVIVGGTALGAQELSFRFRGSRSYFTGFDVTAPAAPSGLMLSSNSVIQGDTFQITGNEVASIDTITLNGSALSFDFVDETTLDVHTDASTPLGNGMSLRVENSAGFQTFGLSVQTGIPNITSTPSGTTLAAGGFFSYTMQATGNPAPSFSMTSGPTWLSVNGDVLSGTPPTQAGGMSFSVSVAATNSRGSDSQQFSLTITQQPSAPAITSTEITTAIIGQEYRYTVTTSGFPAATLSTNTLPAWLSFSGNLLSGTPAESDFGLTSQIQITATNSLGIQGQSFMIDVTYDLGPGNGPTISSVTPTPIMAGAQMTITGTRFLSPTVRIGSTTQTVVSWTPTEIVCAVSSSTLNGSLVLRVITGEGETSMLVTVEGGATAGGGGGGGGGGGCAMLARSNLPFALIALCSLLSLVWLRKRQLTIR